MLTRSAFADAQSPRQVHGRFRHTQGVPSGLFLAQIQGARPTFDGGIVCEREFDIGTLQTGEQSRVLQRNRRLTCESAQELKPLGIGSEWRAQKKFQHALELTLGQQRCRIVRDETCVGEQFGARVAGGGREVLQADDLAL